MSCPAEQDGPIRRLPHGPDGRGKGQEETGMVEQPRQREVRRPMNAGDDRRAVRDGQAVVVWRLFA